MRRRDLLRTTALASAVIAMGWAVTADGADATPPTVPNWIVADNQPCRVYNPIPSREIRSPGREGVSTARPKARGSWSGAPPTARRPTRATCVRASSTSASAAPSPPPRPAGRARQPRTARITWRASKGGIAGGERPG